jgi:hypothetical protein
LAEPSLNEQLNATKHRYTYQSYIYSPTDALVRCLENKIKIYIKIYIKTAPTCFGVTVTPSAGSTLKCGY